MYKTHSNVCVDTKDTHFNGCLDIDTHFNVCVDIRDTNFNGCIDIRDTDFNGCVDIRDMIAATKLMQKNF